MNRLANVHGIRTHLNRQRKLTNHANPMGANHTAAQDLAVAMVVGFRGIINQLGDTFVAAVGNGAA